MKNGVVLALAAILLASGARAQSNDGLSGQWVARKAPIEIDATRTDASCVTRRDSLNPNPFSSGAQTQPQAAELDLTVDSATGKATGSISLPPAWQYSECGPPKFSGCGRLQISEGRVNGRSIAFTTHVKVNGSRIPTRWVGEAMQDGSISLRALDTLPCKVAQRLAPNGGLGILNRPRLSNGPRVYRRGEEPDDRKADSAGASGKWWTVDDGQVAALDIKVSDKGKIKGSVSVCGEPPRKIQKGSLVGNALSFETEETFGEGLLLGGPMRPAPGVWTGKLINGDTLTLSSSLSSPCQLPSGLSLVFTRTGKDRKYVA